MAVIYADQPCIDPAKLAEECDKLGIPIGEWRGVANRFYCPRGIEHGHGDILLTRRNLDNIDRTKSHTLEFKDVAGKTIALKKISVLAATCVTPGKPADPSAVYHVKVADVRYLWRMFALDKGFNANLTPGDDAYSDDTSNEGSAKSWEEVWLDIVDPIPIGDQEGAIAAAFGSLPSGFDGVPTDLHYWGMNVVDAIRDFTQRLGLALAYDPIKNKATLVVPGEEQQGLDREMELLTGRRLHDAEPLLENLTFVPSNIRVLFPKRPEAGWGRDPWFSIDITNDSPPDGVIEGSTAIIRDDLQAVMSANTCTNQSELNDRAIERAAAYSRQFADGHGYKQVLYSGVVDSILPGSIISAVVWEDRGDGLKTEIVQRPFIAQSVATWKSNPNDERWRQAAFVWVYSSVSGVTPPTQCKPAQVEHFDATSGEWIKLFDCWYREMNGQTPVVGRHLALFAGQKANGANDSRALFIGGCCPDGTGDGPGNPPGDDEDDPTSPTGGACEIPCGGCYLPMEVTAVIAGNTNGSCTGCNNTNGTYTLTWQGLSPYRGCSWIYEGPYDAGCGSSGTPSILLFYDTENIFSATHQWCMYVSLGATSYLAAVTGTWDCSGGSNVFNFTPTDYCTGSVTVTVSWTCP